MRIPFFSFSSFSPFDDLQEHAEKVKECAWVFQQAIECHTSGKCERFEEHREEVDNLESEADAIKRRIRGHIPRGAKLPVHKFQLFLYLKEQDKVLDSVEDSLNWLSYRIEPGIPDELRKDFFTLVDSVIEPLEELSRVVEEAKKYFDNYSDRQRNIVKGIIDNLRKMEYEADKIEDALKQRIFSINTDPVTTYHMIKLVEFIGSIADHAENSGDMMRAMIARKR